MTEGSPTLRAIYEILLDGQPHTKEELHKRCCGPSSVEVIWVHITRLKKIIPADHDIVCVTRNKRSMYRLVRRLASATDGRR